MMMQMKSQGDMLFRVASSILLESKMAYASLGKEFDRDIESLARGWRTRGLAFFTLDLPSLDSVLTSGLELGALSAKGPLTRRRSKVDTRPTFLFGLWSQVFDHEGCLIETADPTAIFFLRSICCLGKKISVACTPDRLQKAVSEYHEIESKIIPPILSWTADDPFDGYDGRSYRFRDSFMFNELPLFEGKRVERHRAARLLAAMDRICALLTCELGYFDPTDGPFGATDGRGNPIGRFRHGPGAVADGRARDFKYEFPFWPRKLDTVFPYDYCGSYTPDVTRIPDHSEPPCRLIAVPKTAKGPRLIAAEPTAHQWCQQRVATWLSDRFSSTLAGRFISLNDQTKSQDLVRQASTQSYLMTVDLSSASDRMSCRHVESLFRANLTLLEAVHACRTRWVRDDISNPPNFLVLKKFAAMGSALTFPVQSLFFLCCCLAACGATDRKSILALEGKVRVYGDDLILPIEAYADMVVLFDCLGLKINFSKSFASGEFRESCGADFFKGYDVTPLKPKTLIPDTPEACQAVLDQANNFFLKGLWLASDLLKSTLQGYGYRIPVVGLASGVSAYNSFCGPDLDSFITRRNRWLHRDEVRVYQLIAGTTRVKQSHSSTLLQYFTEAPGPDTYWTSGVPRNRVATFAPRWVDFDVVAA